MFSQFYHGLIRRYHIAFASLFKQVTLARTDANGKEAQRFVVPIEYAARELWLDRLRREPDLGPNAKVVVPKLAFEMSALHYDASRKLNSLNQRVRPSYDGSIRSAKRFFVGTPYTFSFNLYALTRSEDDAQQIVEQIVPYFTPDYTLLVKLIPSVGVTDRMRILMNGQPTWEDNFAQNGGTGETREIIVTFSFSVQATMFGPIAATPSSIIRKVIVDLYTLDYDTSLTGPVYIRTESFDRLELEDDSGYIIDESSV